MTTEERERVATAAALTAIHDGSHCYEPCMHLPCGCAEDIARAILAALPAAQAAPDGWQDIATAPKQTEFSYDKSEYGPYFLGFPVQGRVARVRWWQSTNVKDREEGYHNFLSDGGIACRLTHWRPLPAPPVIAEERGP